MNIERTLAIIATLADGRDPASHATLAADHVCQQPEVIRALHQARELVARQARLERSRERARVTLPRNTGRSWSSDEERVLALRFRSGKTVMELAEAHGRTSGGIRSRLVRLGLLGADGQPAGQPAPAPDAGGRSKGPH